MSLIDEIVGIIFALHFRDQWEDIYTLLLSLLDPSIVQSLEAFRNTSFDARLLYNDASVEDADMVYYQRSFAFAEFRDCAYYRAFVDAVLAPRFLQSWPPKVDESFAERDALSARDLTKALQGLRQPRDFTKVQCCGPFLRSVQLVTFLQANRNTTGFTLHEMRFICEHTTGL
jgi:hypothetical protein